MANINLMLRRQNTLQLIRESNASINSVRGGRNESKEHFLKKAEICYELMQQGKSFVTEAKLKKRCGFKRPDILVLDDMEVIEIAKTEEAKSLTLKRLTYYGMGLKFTVIRI